MQSKDLQAFDINREPGKVQEAYGKTTGLSFGPPTGRNRRRFVEVSHGGWDTQ